MDLTRRAVGIVGPRSESGCCPPPPTESRLARHADARYTVDRQRDEHRPHRDALEVIGGAVDRVDDPLAGRVAGHAELFAEHAICGAFRLEHRADRAFRRQVGFGHVRGIGLGLDVEIRRIEATHGCCIRRVGQPQSEREIGAEITLERRVERRSGFG